MRIVRVSVLLLAPGIAFAQGTAVVTPAQPGTPQASAPVDDDQQPVYDFGGGGQVVVDTSGGNAARPDAQFGPNGGQPTGYWFYGPHPDSAGGWDPTEGPHMHDYPPVDQYLFTQENGYNYFVGDPLDYGYGGPASGLFGYYGYHPIAVIYGGGYCYYSGYHHHFWQPWGTAFVATNGWYYYNGPFTPYFYTYRSRYDWYFRNVYPHRVFGQPAVAVGRPVINVGLPVQRFNAAGAPSRLTYSNGNPVLTIHGVPAAPTNSTTYYGTPVTGGGGRAPAPVYGTPATGSYVRPVIAHPVVQSPQVNTYQGPHTYQAPMHAAPVFHGAPMPAHPVGGGGRHR
jgi:hypothetical protein